jgi:hypothetical protein
MTRPTAPEPAWAWALYLLAMLVAIGASAVWPLWVMP